MVGGNSGRGLWEGFVKGTHGRGLWEELVGEFTTNVRMVESRPQD